MWIRIGETDQIRKADQMSEAPELRPCPFCGGEAMVNFDELGDTNLAHVMCTECWASGPERDDGSEQLAWNTRPLYDAQAKVIEAAKAWNAARTIFNQCDEEETWSHLTALEEAERGLGEALAALDRQCPVCGGWVYVGDACCPKCSPEALAALQENT